MVLKSKERALDVLQNKICQKNTQPASLFLQLVKEHYNGELESRLPINNIDTFLSVTT
jgi:hypothetical protein